MNELSNKVLSAYVRGIYSKYEERCSIDPQQLQKIMSEHGINYVDHSCCDGFCPDCEQILSCEAYEELKGEWEGFYT
ncbi:MAG: hypothetical protein HZB61_09070 [Nitrospirae bacterium]|nr:hypothetical protein [Nitrospirota bacterium]